MNHVKRITRETSVELSLELAPGDGVIETPCGFLNHMITLLAHHAGWQVRLAASGDLAVDAHHLTEDVGIALGQALLQELQSGPPRRRYGECMLPMDGTLVLAAVDLSGRGFLAWEGTFPSPRCGDFDT
ncbi:MAG TPA: imidazoleglycerol-phosphate dehydratase, partial [Synergistaceae bacterium]|nr:imidazoleglycerol-phosphate dehydratase [Synergistaceae bacterium]